MTAIIGRNILSLGLSRIVSGVILFFVYIRAVTYLGPAEFGKFSLVLAYFTIFLLLVDAGISRFVIKKVSEEKKLGSVYLGNFLVVQLFLGAAALLLFFLIPRWLGYEHSVAQSMLIAGIGLAVTSLSLPYAAIVQAWQRINLVAGINFLNTIVNAFWLALAIILRQNIQFIFLLYIILGVINVILYAYFAKGHARLNFRLEKGLVKSLFAYGAPFALISGFEILIAKIDVIIQKHFLPYSQVGLYSSAYRFVDILTFIPAVVAITLFPFLSEKKDLSAPEVPGLLNHLNRYMAALAVPLGVGATLAAGKIILTLYDARFLGSVRPFQILVWSSAFSLVYAVPNVIMLVRKTALTVWLLAGATALNAAANWILVPRFGILASAWINMATYASIGAAYIFFAHSEAVFRLFRYFFWPIVGSAVMGYAIYLFRLLNIFAITAISVVIYSGFLYAVKFIQKEDLVFLKSIFKKPGL